jgi:hypothetical protein
MHITNNSKKFWNGKITRKSQMMEFLRQDQVRSKIVVNNKCLQQINNFQYLGCEIFYQNEKDIQQKLARLAQILGILNNTFKLTLFLKFSTMELYNAPALPILSFGREIWTLKKKKKG